MRSLFELAGRRRPLDAGELSQRDNCYLLLCVSAPLRREQLLSVAPYQLGAASYRVLAQNLDTGPAPYHVRVAS